MIETNDYFKVIDKDGERDMRVFIFHCKSFAIGILIAPITALVYMLINYLTE